MSVVTLKANDVAEELGITPGNVKYGILNHTMPIGTAFQAPDSSRARTIIIKTRYDAWKEARDLRGGIAAPDIAILKEQIKQEIIAELTGNRRA